MKKTQEEVKTELNNLRSIKPLIPHYDVYGINNHNLHNAQMQVLRYGLEMVDIIYQWRDDLDSLGAAEDANYWMSGGSVLSPVDSWGKLGKTENKSA